MNNPQGNGITQDKMLEMDEQMKNMGIVATEPERPKTNKQRHPNAKHSFIQYIAATESKDFDNPDDSWIQWAIAFVSTPSHWIENDIHMGDCTNQCCSCYLCSMERLLTEYRKYFFSGEVPE